MDKEKWIETTLHSADGMNRAQAPDVLARVEARIGSRHIGMTISTGALYRIAASVVMLVALNVAALSRHHTAQDQRWSAPSGPWALFGLSATTSQQTDIGDLFFGNERANHE
ncbi:MAG: hypothetical protein JSS76_13550 [Bacteroidetes bacterium]|nr:hypothetical protein [Bacteroidota bacterium]MBS1685768.1 hypothetical protein [Bacteroidota bacterium]